jgi:hypothetical protein
MTTQHDQQTNETPEEAKALAPPTLTEVVDLNVAASIRVEEVVQEVLKELQQHMDGVLEYRLRETLTPILTRLGDTLIRETRQEWTQALHSLVERAVEQSLQRRQSSN